MSVFVASDQDHILAVPFPGGDIRDQMMATQRNPRMEDISQHGHALTDGDRRAPRCRVPRYAGVLAA